MLKDSKVGWLPVCDNVKDRIELEVYLLHVLGVLRDSHLKM